METGIEILHQLPLFSLQVNQMTDVKTAGHVSNVLKDVLKSNIGWEASGGMDINSTAFFECCFLFTPVLTSPFIIHYCMLGNR
jgi:hypothetical protein